MITTKILQVKRLGHAGNQGAPKQDTFWNSKPANNRVKLRSLGKKVAFLMHESKCERRDTTKTSVFEKQRTSTPTSFVSVIPLPKRKRWTHQLNHYVLMGKNEIASKSLLKILEKSSFTNKKVNLLNSRLKLKLYGHQNS